MSVPEHCNGCTVLQEFEQCHILLRERGYGCPCGTCLVKIMCNGICEKAEEYMSSIDWSILPRKEK